MEMVDKVSKRGTLNNEFLHLSDKLDILDERLDSIDKILVKQEENLAAHMARTELLEQQVDPLNKFMWAAYGIIAFIGVLGTLVGIVVAVA